MRTRDGRHASAAAEPADDTLSAVRTMMEAAAQAPQPEGRRPVAANRTRSDIDRSETARQPARPFAALPEAAETAPGGGVLSRLGRMLPRKGGAAERAAPVEGLKARLAGFEPTRKQAALVALVAVMVWWPWLIPGLLFLTFWAGLIAYFSLGPDRVSELVVSAWAKFEKRSPERAARSLARIQAAADRIDGWLARLPERWTDGIYLPDLGRSQVIEAASEPKGDPFDRLASERETGRGRHGLAGM